MVFKGMPTAKSNAREQRSSQAHPDAPASLRESRETTILGAGRRYFETEHGLTRPGLPSAEIVAR